MLVEVGRDPVDIEFVDYVRRNQWQVSISNSIGFKFSTACPSFPGVGVLHPVKYVCVFNQKAFKMVENPVNRGLFVLKFYVPF